jgi:hypothetical protein
MLEGQEVGFLGAGPCRVWVLSGAPLTSTGGPQEKGAVRGVLPDDVVLEEGRRAPGGRRDSCQQHPAGR